ncbi:jg24198, partial [Pararge aegeria aegeria]
GGHSRPLRCGSERKKKNASYVLMVFQQRNGADSFGDLRQLAIFRDSSDLFNHIKYQLPLMSIDITVDRSSHTTLTSNRMNEHRLALST